MSLDRDAIERLYRSHGHIVLRRARALLSAPAEAEEALHEVFAALLRDPQAPRGSPVVWLYQATTHFCLNRLRNARTSVRILGAQRTAGDDVEGPRAEALAQAQSLLAQLPPEVAAALVYHHVDGMTHTEVAEMLGCSRRQVGYLLERASEQLGREEERV